MTKPSNTRIMLASGALFDFLEVADWLSSNLRGTVSREQIVAAVRAGSHRPELPPVKPAAASLEGNLK